jgi:hypothetical protein
MSEITGEMSVTEAVRIAPQTRKVFDRHGLKGCGGEHGPSESISFFAAVHRIDLAKLLCELNQEAPVAGRPYVYQEGAADVIYRRFFKAAIVTILSVGCMWGAINLLQIALGRSFLQLKLLPAIHAHAQAMISGWVGLFVMGFAYQSFPRFKNTTLWRPDLANDFLFPHRWCHCPHHRGTDRAGSCLDVLWCNRVRIGNDGGRGFRNRVAENRAPIH